MGLRRASSRRASPDKPKGEGSNVKLATKLGLIVPLLVLAPQVWAQNEPLILEAETGAVGSAFNIGSADGVQFASISSTVASFNPSSDTRVITFTVNFVAPGTYELYARLRVGAATFNDDSFYYGNGFGVKPVSADGTADPDWILANGLAAPVGFTLPSDKVVGGGTAQSGVWKWVKLSAFDGGEQPVAGFVVTAGALTQTFQIGGREDGLDIDKLAFGVQGRFYTVNDLDNRLPGTTEPPPPPFTPSGPPIATGKAKFLGSAHSPAQNTSFTAYWNQVTPENGTKWASVEATRDVMNWGEADAAYNLARANGFPFKLHTLIWGNQQPAWIETLSTAEQRAEIEQWFDEAAAKYPDVDFIDVVNEPLHDPPAGAGNGNYIEALGGTGATGWDWVITAFDLARRKFPNAKLFINEFSVTNNTADMQRYIEIIQLLKARNLIDGVGVQGHAFSTRPNIPMSTHQANLDLLAATGLPIHVSEFDIDGPTDEVQLADYQRVFPVFWNHPGVTGITLWGFRIGHWRTAQGAYIVLANGAERPAMRWLQAFVGNNVPLVTVGQKFPIDGGTRHVIGTAIATDADVNREFGYATLQNWRITGGNGASIFGIDQTTGAIRIVRPLFIDFRRSSYTLQLTVSDGAGTSEPEAVTIQIPNKVRMCVFGHDVQLPKAAAWAALLVGGTLGRCAR
jgi:endo-1,4-beta-xylanase